MTTIAKQMTAATKKSNPLDHAMDQKRRDKAGRVADRKTGAKPSSIKVVTVRVEDVRVPKKWRSINKEKLESIAKSMKGIGHRNPISVRAIKKWLSPHYGPSSFRGREKTWVETHQSDCDAW